MQEITGKCEQDAGAPRRRPALGGSLGDRRNSGLVLPGKEHTADERPDDGADEADRNDQEDSFGSEVELAALIGQARKLVQQAQGAPHAARGAA
jgi:hypothetical protein